MTAHTCYEGTYVNSFQFYLEKSGEHSAILQYVRGSLLQHLQRIGAGKSSLEVLGVGSGGGEMDVQMLSLLQSTFPGVPITADIVEGSAELTDNFKALVAKTTSLDKIQFSWHIMSSEEYGKQVKAKGDMKKFDFIHMIQMIYYVENLGETIKFYRSLLKKNGKLMIIIEAGLSVVRRTSDNSLPFLIPNDPADSGWDILWKTFSKELCVGDIKEYRASREVVDFLNSQGLKYEEHSIPNKFDISECFNPSSVTGERLLSFMTGKDHFYESFTPEIRAGILDLLRSKCSTEKDGRVTFNSDLKCILVHD